MCKGVFGCYRTETAGPPCVTTSRPLSYPHLSSVFFGGDLDNVTLAGGYYLVYVFRITHLLCLDFPPFFLSLYSRLQVHLTFIESVNSCGYLSTSAFHDALSGFIRRIKAPEANLPTRSFLMHAASLQDKFLGGTRNPRSYLYSVFKGHNSVMELRCVV